MTNQPDLQAMMDQAREVFVIYVALQESGFSELQAFALMPPLILSGALKKPESA